MAIKSRFDDVANLVDTEQGFISREIFVDPDLYKEELDKVFTRAWLFIGHESLIPNPGDFYTTRMGEESVILCRDKKGVVHAFLNSCRHRGMKVCRYEQGNTSIFTCPYHSWTYTTDGKLQGVPQYRSLYDGNLDRDANSLVPVAKLAIYKGTVWATWDKNAPEFLTYLGDAKIHLDQALDCRDGREGGSEVIGVHKWVFPANWKFAAENFLGDTYHNPSHRSVDLIGIGPSAASGKKAGATTSWKRRSTSGSAFRKATACTARSSRSTTSTSNCSSTTPCWSNISAIATRSESDGSANRPG